MERIEFGRRGEDHAAEYIEGLGWRVLARNWRCREGEADIVAWDPESDALVVVEVKSRSGTGYGSPLEAITYAKAARLRRLAAIFARESKATARRLRVDALGILWRPGTEPELIHARGIEEW
ncbi:MAG: YraN family protein [Arachnia sp.]